MTRFRTLLLLVILLATVLAAPLSAQCVWTSGTTTLYESCGYVGIGTSAPTAAVHINAPFQSLTPILFTGSEYFQAGYSSVGGLAMLLGVNRPANKQLWIADSEALSATSPTTTVLRINVGGAAATIDAIGTDAAPRQLNVGNLGGVAMSPNGGSVGVGTAAPTGTLHVVGPNTIPQFKISRPGSAGTIGAFTYDVNNSALLFDTDYVSGWQTRANTGAMLYKLSDHLSIFGASGGPSSTPAWANYFDVDLTSGGVGLGTVAPAGTRFAVNGNTSLTGSATVTGNLTVNGNASFSGTVTGGNIQARYQDVAEWVAAEGTLAPGTVVVVNPEARNGVMASSEEYQTSVAGVVSAKPGIILGEGSATKAQIATTGRVKVHVDATRGAIRPGDLLVTSAEAGVAMKSEPVEIHGRKLHLPGTIIGKALEPLEAGKGDILVLLSLQ